MRNGLSGHIGSIWKMIHRANCEDGFWNDACTKSFSLEDLSSEVESEMEVSDDRQQVKAIAVKEQDEIA